MAIEMVSKVDTICTFVLFAVALAAAGAITDRVVDPMAASSGFW
jgi:hypothetical protein